MPGMPVRTLAYHMGRHLPQLFWSGLMTNPTPVQAASAVEREDGNVIEGRMLLSYRYRLLPTKGQHRRLGEALEQCRQLYNAGLEERIDCYRKTGREGDVMLS